MIRPLRASDIGAAMALKAAAGWNQTEADWETVLTLQPDGCWAYEAEGRAVGSTTAVLYGTELAWIGMVLVLPEFRRRGIARALMRTALDFCDAAGVRCVKLDATEMGRPLYAELGFREERPIERWSSAAAPATVPSATVQAGWRDDLAAIDSAAVGTDRTRLLRLLSERNADQVFRRRDGFVMGRPGAAAAFLGPCAADNPAAARALIETWLARRTAKPVFWDILPDNAAAVELAQALGFDRRRRLSRMVRGEPAPSVVERAWACGGFEFG